MNTKQQKWPVSSGNPMIIAGPCSAETEDQVLQTARALKEINEVNLFRAGIWKPRTRPGSFEGMGSTALPWLMRVKKEVGLPVAVEVANFRHVYDALKAGIDVLWVGARTTANPFAMQEIADALKGVDVPVLVKNPVNPDVALWIGALERLEKSGIQTLGAIHRGVTQFGKSMFRNNPEWQMAIQLREELPELLLLNDPSHIAGKRELVPRIAQTAMDLKFDGLMIETHTSPETALSDAAQQITPKELTHLISDLVIRTETPRGIELKNIDELRKSINFIDNQIIDLLSFRKNVVQEIAAFKLQNQMTVFQENRWNALLNKHIEQGQQLGLSSDFISSIFHEIHQNSIDNQLKVINKNKLST